jgi:hypothetical protein
MSVYCKQKQLLLSNHAFIEVKSLITGRTRQDQLKVWLEVEDYDQAAGEVYTRAGIWHRDDLEFINSNHKGETPWVVAPSHNPY